MFLIPLLLAITQPVVAPSETPKDVRKQFIELAAAKDRAGCVALWRAHPGLVLSTIDADLEGSLKVREKSAEPDLKKITELQERALWGAEIAFEATGHPILRDYTASFVGWNAAEQKSFRAGQAAFGKAMKSLDAKDAAAALSAGTECLQLAAPLGDWWGSAMGYQAIATAHGVLGNHEQALEAASMARLVYHDLGLESDEYEVLGRMIDECKALGRLPRARASLDRALELAKRLKDEAGVTRLTGLRAELDAKK